MSRPATGWQSVGSGNYAHARKTPTVDRTVEERNALVESMDASIEGYVAFLGQKSDGMVQNAFKLAGEKMDLFGQEVVKLGAP